MMNKLFSIIALITCTISTDVTDPIELNANLSSLYSALFDTGLLPTLRGTGPFTVFAPINDAFTAASPLPSNISDVRDILLYHVVNGTELSKADLSDGLIITTMNGQSITVQRDGSDVYFYDSKGRRAMLTNINSAGNGIVHFIDMVLFPDGKISDITSNVDDLSTLNGALVAYGLNDTLASPGTFTVFAPTNDAVAMFSGTIDDVLLLYHVLGTVVEAADVPTTPTIVTTVSGYNLTVYRNDSDVFVMDAIGRKGQVTVANIVSTNGIVHIIDIVLVPTATVVEAVSFRDDLSTLSGALSTAGLISALSGNGPFTIFAPTNDAFDAITVPDNVTELAKILKYHVLASEVVSGDLESGLIKETLISQSISVQIDGGVFIYDTMGMTSQVTEADLDCTNGVVHIIDAVLLPDGTIADITANIDSLSTLNGALVANDLDDVLMTDGPFTLFAPTNDAVSAFTGTIDSEVLLYHVVSGQYLAGDVPTTATALATANTDMTELTVERNDNGVFVTDQDDRTGQVTMANVISTNGVVHVIDIVLSPESIMPETTMDMSSANKLSASLSIFFFVLCVCIVYFN